MNENVVLLVIDELTANAVNKTMSNGLKTTPFLDELSKKSVRAERMYSQAPYTEAAIRNLLYGHDVLDKLENIFYQSDVEFTYYKYLAKNEYDIFNMTIDLHSCFQGEEAYQLCASNNWNTFYQNRLKEFVPFVEKEDINSLNICYELILNMFNSCIDFYMQMLNNNENVKHFKQYFDIDETKGSDILSKYLMEKEKLEKEKNIYVRDFFIKGRYKEFSLLDKLIEKQFMSDDKLRNYAIKKHNSLMRCIRKIGFKHNIRNSKISVKSLQNNINLILNGEWWHGLQNIKYLIINYINLMLDVHIKFYNEKSIISKPAESLGMFKSFFDFLENRDSNKPFFAYFHSTEVHGPANYFNIHANNYDDINEEYELVLEFIKALPEDFKGSLNYYVAVRIIDERIKKFYNELKKRDLLDNLFLIITSDHGTSYMYDKIRPEMVNNFYDTQYHIPFILYNKNLEPYNIKTFTYSKDVPATIFSVLNIPMPEYFTGHNLLDKNYNNSFVIHEYLGGGCPDYYHKPIRMCARGEDYKIVYFVLLSGKFEEGELKEIHDLRKDPYEEHNLIFSEFDETRVIELLNVLENRFNIIKLQLK